MKSLTLSTLSLFVCLLILPLTSFAASGVVEGRLTFYNNQGNFCPTYRNCTGSQYPESQFEAILGIRGVKVYLRDSVSGAIIGQTISDSNGNFTMSWSKSGSNISGYIVHYLEEGNGRFQILDSDETTHRMFSGSFPLTNGTTTSNPQDIGNFNWGNASNPNPFANVYDGAWRSWNYAFKYSGLMLSHFNGVKIYGLNPIVAGQNCPTSCAWGGDSIIIDSVDSAYSPQARIMHEFGHIGSYLASPDQEFQSYNGYCWPNNTGVCGWRPDTPEWGAPQFEEGLASFLGDVSIYWYNNPAPHTCLISASECPTNSSNVETSTETGNCATNENRWPLSVTRYLWDLYDTTEEDTWDDTSEGYHWFFTAINSFEGGSTTQFGNRGKNEPYNSSWNVVDRDGRSAYDFYFIWEDLHSNGDYAVRSNNCLPGVGD